jgi:hypothetical protein
MLSLWVSSDEDTRLPPIHDSAGDMGFRRHSQLPYYLIVAALWRLDLFQIIYKNWVRTSQETHYVSATKTNRLMVFRETVAFYCENHTEHTNTLYGHNAEFLCVKAGGAYSNHWALKG